MSKNYYAEVINAEGCTFDFGNFDNLDDAKAFCHGRGTGYIGNVIEDGNVTEYGVEEKLVYTYTA